MCHLVYGISENLTYGLWSMTYGQIFVMLHCYKKFSSTAAFQGKVYTSEIYFPWLINFSSPYLMLHRLKVFHPVNKAVVCCKCWVIFVVRLKHLIIWFIIFQSSKYVFPRWNKWTIPYIVNVLLLIFVYFNFHCWKACNLWMIWNLIFHNLFFLRTSIYISHQRNLIVIIIF